jgi:anti-anti-sigma factor
MPGMPVQKWSNRIWVTKLGDLPGFSEDLDYLLENATTEDPPPDVVLDMANVSQLSSSQLSHLLRLRKQLLDRGLRLRIAGPSNALWALFLSTGLDKVFTFSEDTSTALADLQIARRDDSYRQ